MTFRIGADPEAFLVNRDGKYISSVGLIGGSKQAPLQLGDGFAIQEDNVAVEYNIPPCETAEAFVSAINKGLEHLRVRVEKYGLELKFSPSANFTPDQLDSYQAKVFGCEPDLNAWTQKFNKRPGTKDKSLRSCGGHVHIQTTADPFLVGRWMDAIAGLPFVTIDTDAKRRLLYGKAGAMRIKDYPGMEYRTLSNKWLETDNLKIQVFNWTKKATELAESGLEISNKIGVKIRRAINTSDPRLAEIAMKEVASIAR